MNFDGTATASGLEYGTNETVQAMPGISAASAEPASSVTRASNFPGDAGNGATRVTRAGSLRPGSSGTLAFPSNPGFTQCTSFSSMLRWTTTGAALTTVRNTSSGMTVPPGTSLLSWPADADQTPLWNLP